jgi:hypothetical protein
MPDKKMRKNDFYLIGWQFAIFTKRQTPNAKRQTPNAKRQTPNAKRQTSQRPNARTQ